MVRFDQLSRECKEALFRMASALVQTGNSRLPCTQLATLAFWPPSSVDIRNYPLEAGEAFQATDGVWYALPPIHKGRVSLRVAAAQQRAARLLVPMLNPNLVSQEGFKGMGFPTVYRVAVVVRNGEGVLVGTRHGKLSVPQSFVRSGEGLSQAAARTVRAQVALRWPNQKKLSSQLLSQGGPVSFADDPGLPSATFVIQLKAARAISPGDSVPAKPGAFDSGVLIAVELGMMQAALNGEVEPLYRFLKGAGVNATSCFDGGTHLALKEQIAHFVKPRL